MCRGRKSLLKLVERVMGIDPTSSAWKAEVLPLNYTRLEMTPKYSILTTESAGSRVRPPHGGGGRIRTYEGVSRQIYSLLPFAAWVPLRENRAAYSDFRYRACQCRFRANWPNFSQSFGSGNVQKVKVGPRDTPSRAGRPRCAPLSS